jgi:hypothetical protein
MEHEATSRAGQQCGSAMGAHYRHTTPEMAARSATAIGSASRWCRGSLSRPLRSSRVVQHSECSSGYGSRFLANLWQTALRAGVEDALCLVELRGFEPLTPCMPWTVWRLQKCSPRAFAQVNRQAKGAAGDRGCPWLSPAPCPKCAPGGPETAEHAAAVCSAVAEPALIQQLELEPGPGWGGSA